MVDLSDYNFPNPNTGLGSKLASSVIRTKMDSGRVRQRRRFTRALQTIGLSWDFTDAQYAVFQAVFEYRLNQGADWFTMSLPVGDGFKTVTARFVGEWSSKYVPVMQWTLSASIEIESGSALSEAELDILFPPE